MTSLDTAFEQIDRFVELRVTEAHMPGMAIAITDQNRVLKTSAFGFAHTAARELITAETMFEIGSIGKSEVDREN